MPSVASGGRAAGTDRLRCAARARQVCARAPRSGANPRRLRPVDGRLPRDARGHRPIYRPAAAATLEEIRRGHAITTRAAAEFTAGPARRRGLLGRLRLLGLRLRRRGRGAGLLGRLGLGGGGLGGAGLGRGRRVPLARAGRRIAERERGRATAQQRQTDNTSDHVLHKAPLIGPVNVIGCERGGGEGGTRNAECGMLNAEARSRQKPESRPSPPPSPGVPGEGVRAS